MKRIFAGVASVALLTAGLVSLSLPAQAADEPYFETPHVWINPLTNANTSFSVMFQGFTTLPGTTVVSGTAPAYRPATGSINLLTSCTSPTATGVSPLECHTSNNPLIQVAAGEYSTSVIISNDQNGVVTHNTYTLPITVCNGACSDLFDFTVAPGTLRYLVGSPVQAAGRGVFDFNVAWNAVTLGIGNVTNSSGVVAAGTYSPLAEQIRDGSAFQFAGSFTQPGEYSFPVSIVDEFGVTHVQTVPLIVCADENCMQGIPSLASTGLNDSNLAGLATLLVASGLVLLRLRRSAFVFKH